MRFLDVSVKIMTHLHFLVPGVATSRVLVPIDHWLMRREQNNQVHIDVVWEWMFICFGHFVCESYTRS